MADIIAATFRGPWRLVVAADVEVSVVSILLWQGAWAALTPRSRAALVAVARSQGARVHPSTRRALIRHGLLDDTGLTEAGRRVVRHRPTRLPPRHVDGRRIVDVHLPEVTPC